VPGYFHYGPSGTICANTNQLLVLS